ncbi:MAG: 4Fe-4S dicluster domain-containing protein [Patescibacteria group bacterium]
MKSIVTEFQLEHIFRYIEREYSIFGTKKEGGDIKFGILQNFHQIPIPTPKTTMPFKGIVWPNHFQYLPAKKEARKLAFFGLTNCDVIALAKLYKEFSETNLLPGKPLVISTECKPDGECFCTAFGHNEVKSFDLHIQSNGKKYDIFSGSTRGQKILIDCGIKNDPKARPITPIEKNSEIINLNLLEQKIEDKAGSKAFWQGIASNCFGCGACTAVCPLCYCTKQEIVNDEKSGCRHCLSWDSCFSKSFSEIQNHFDYRPENADRLYNWYHHKFVRAKQSSGQILCTGCGRCIKACPANLNQKKIIQTLANIAEEEDRLKKVDANA